MADDEAASDIFELRARQVRLAVDVLVDQQARWRMAEGAEEEGGQGAVGAVRAFYLCPSSFNLRLRSMKSTICCSLFETLKSSLSPQYTAHLL